MAGKVSMACALGGGIGAFIALQTWQPLWWVGTLVGGLVGYLAYEFDEVRRAILLAWQRATGWRPNWEWWGMFRRLFPTIMLGAPSQLLLPFLALAVLVTRIDRVLGVSIIGLTAFLCIGFGYMLTSATIKRRSNLPNLLQEHRKANAFRLYFWVFPRAMAKGAWLVVTRGPGCVSRGAVTIAKFFRYLFILIHSEERLLCSLDAALGAAIGYWLGNALIGALAGGILGHANFEVVSKRWLKLVPVKAK